MYRSRCDSIRLNATDRYVSMAPQIFRLTACMLLLTVPIMLTAQAVPALLNVQGSANLNDKPVPGTGSIFPGDRLQTMSGSSANITGDSFSVSVPENSSLVFGDNKIDLACGGVTVATTKGTQVRSVGLVIKPVTNAAKFSVLSNDKGLTIAPTQGSVTVDDGKGQPPTVPEGQSFTRQMNTGCNPVRSGAPGTVLPIGAGILAAAGAGILAYCTVGSACRSKSISPSAP